MHDSSTSDRTVDLEDFEKRAHGLSKNQVVEAGSPDLSREQRKYLRGLAHDLSPVVMLGARGPVRTVVDATDEQLHAHELIKVKLHESADIDIRVAALWLRGETGAQIIQLVGHTAVLYKARPKKPTIKLPKAP